MKLLLDTQLLLWAAGGRRRLRRHRGRHGSARGSGAAPRDKRAARTYEALGAAYELVG